MKTWEDIYKLPLYKSKDNDLVFDAQGNFVFVFETEDKKSNEIALEIINGNTTPNIQNNITYEEGYICVNGKPYILIRGWSNLTGMSGHYLPAEDAANIQDTFADFIVERLTKKL